MHEVRGDARCSQPRIICVDNYSLGRKIKFNQAWVRPTWLSYQPTNQPVKCPLTCAHKGQKAAIRCIPVVTQSAGWLVGNRSKYPLTQSGLCPKKKCRSRLYRSPISGQCTFWDQSKQQSLSGGGTSAQSRWVNRAVGSAPRHPDTWTCMQGAWETGRHHL